MCSVDNTNFTNVQQYLEIWKQWEDFDRCDTPLGRVFRNGLLGVSKRFLDGSDLALVISIVDLFFVHPTNGSLLLHAVTHLSFHFLNRHRLEAGSLGGDVLSPSQPRDVLFMPKRPESLRDMGTQTVIH